MCNWKANVKKTSTTTIHLNKTKTKQKKWNETKRNETKQNKTRLEGLLRSNFCFQINILIPLVFVQNGMQ